MIFLQPLGLLGLIGVPIILLIYILKNKYNEQTVPSTYLWKLSERFFKRRNPLSGLTGIIGLILQLLSVVAISLLIARPIFILPDSAGEYCFILDASGSMNTDSDGRTRFERAKEGIGSAIDEASAGSTYTLLSVAGETTVIYERLTDKKLAHELLDRISCTDGTVTYSDALLHAQRYFDSNPSFVVRLYTDKEVVAHDNVEIVNVSLQKEENSAIFDAESSFLGGTLTVQAQVISYGKDRELTVSLYLDGDERAKATKTVSANMGEKTAFSLSCETEGYLQYRIAIEEKDSLPRDNEIIGYNAASESSYRILVVSETPFFLEAVLDALTDAAVDVVSPAQYRQSEEYGLYIFHSYTPESLPDAAVWLINVSENVDDSGFGARGIVTTDAPVRLERAESSSTIVQRLLGGVYGKDISVSEYIKYGGMYTRFHTLFTYNASPLIFAGVNGLGNREVVVGFDLHKADFALSPDFVTLLGNLLAYTCPDVIESTDCVCGSDAVVNLASGMKNVKALTPKGDEIYLDTSADTASFALDSVGTYTVSMLYGGEARAYKIYSSFPEEESDPVQTEERFSLAGEREYERTDGEFDPIVILLVCLVVLFAADWMVYCYEKYQLR